MAIDINWNLLQSPNVLARYGEGQDEQQRNVLAQRRIQQGDEEMAYQRGRDQVQDARTATADARENEEWAIKKPAMQQDAALQAFEGTYRITKGIQTEEAFRAAQQDPRIVQLIPDIAQRTFADVQQINEIGRQLQARKVWEVGGNLVGGYEDGTGLEPLYTAPEKPQWLSVPEGGKLVPVGRNGPMDLGPQGGQPPPATGGDWMDGVVAAAPDAQVTSGYRSPQDNTRVGGVPNSRHMSGEAVDLVPRPGETMAQLYARVRAVPGTRAINEGDHVHVQATGGAAPARPPQAQPGDPAGTIYGAPKVKPQAVRLTPQEMAAEGFEPGTIAYRDPVTGKPEVVQRPRSANEKITEGQRVAAGYAYRMVGANDQTNVLAERGIIRPSAQILISEQNGVARLVARDPKDALFVQNASEWIMAKLRRESGAAIGTEELANEFTTFYPQPGDSDELIRQKAASRRRATVAMLNQGRAAYEDQFGPVPKEIQTRVPAPRAAPTNRNNPGRAAPAGQVRVRTGAGFATVKELPGG